MTRELCLLRHGKADRNLAMDDFDRPLKNAEKAAQHIGEGLHHLHLIPTGSEFACKKSPCHSENRA